MGTADRAMAAEVPGRGRTLSGNGDERMPSLLIVTTVASTMGFLLPYVRHFRLLGWRVDGCARGISDYSRAVGMFDSTFEMPSSRSIRDARAILTSAGALRAVLGHGYDIVHVHTPIAAFMTRMQVRLMPRERRPRLVYTAHGFHFHKQGNVLANAAFAAAERLAGRWTDRLIVINREDYNAALRYRVVPRQRLTYMPGIGVDTNWYAREQLSQDAIQGALSGLGMDPRRPYFVTVGELSRRKRPEDVVRAFALLPQDNLGLLLLGEGPRRKVVEDTAAELRVADRVVLAGSVEDVRPFVAGALALVQASSREGLPRSIMEAMSLEIPVVATTARGHQELVGADRGAVVPVGDTDRMAEAMNRLAVDSNLRRTMGRGARQLMVERYDIKCLIEQHEQLYDKLLDGARNVIGSP